MSVYFDKQVFEKFQAKAIQSAEELVVGQTYYSNSYPEKFVFHGLLTNKEAYNHEGITWTDEVTENDVCWYLYQNVETGRKDSSSLKDRNIGAHYNPWLIFANEEDCKACRAELTPHYSRDF